MYKNKKIHSNFDNAPPNTDTDTDQQAPAQETQNQNPPNTPLLVLSSIWNWLPAFRAVAETENLRIAAQWIGSSPPALSRTIKLLEEHINLSLFTRRDGRLILNASGKKLLSVVHIAMRHIDDALQEIQGQEQRRELVIHVPYLLQMLYPIKHEEHENPIENHKKYTYTIHPHHGITSEMWQGLEKGNIDLLIDVVDYPVAAILQKEVLGNIEVSSGLSTKTSIVLYGYLRRPIGDSSVGIYAFLLRLASQPLHRHP